ncbi:MAG: IclR family transcriptional regulator [bacterium]
MAVTYHLVQSLVKSLAIIDILAESSDGMGVTEIGEKVGMNKSTVHRILTTLVHEKYVEQDRVKGNYRLSLKVFEIARKILNNIRPTKVITPYLEKLAEQTGESARFSVVDYENTRLIVCDEVLTLKPIKVRSHLGESLSLSGTAAGKMFLANMSDEKIKDIMDQKGRKTVLEDDNYSFSQLRGDLNVVREKGYAYDRGQDEVEMICDVAAPVYDETGRIIALIEVFVPAFRCQKNFEQEAGKLVKHAAHEISLKLGFLP